METIITEVEDVPTYVVELSKSGRAQCKRCDNKIPQQELRVGIIVDSPMGIFTRWLHLDCAVFHKSIKSATVLDGYSGLDDTNKTLLQRRVEQSQFEDDPDTAAVDPDELVRKEWSEQMEAPADLLMPLLPFQKEGLGWMVHQESTSVKGGILADEMGMGKTIQAISLILANKPVPVKSGKDKYSAQLLEEWNQSDSMHEIQPGSLRRAGTLVVLPTVAIRQWQTEIFRFTKEASLTVVVYHGSGRTVDLEKLYSADVVLTSYKVLEIEYRKATAGTKVECRICGQKFYPDKLRVHRKYFCGETAKRTAAQSKTEKKKSVVRSVSASRRTGRAEGSEEEEEEEDEVDRQKRLLKAVKEGKRPTPSSASSKAVAARTAKGVARAAQSKGQSKSRGRGRAVRSESESDAESEDEVDRQKKRIKALAEERDRKASASAAAKASGKTNTQSKSKSKQTLPSSAPAAAVALASVAESAPSSRATRASRVSGAAEAAAAAAVPTKGGSSGKTESVEAVQATGKRKEKALPLPITAPVSESSRTRPVRTSTTTSASVKVKAEADVEAVDMKLDTGKQTPSPSIGRNVRSTTSSISASKGHAVRRARTPSRARKSKAMDSDSDSDEDFVGSDDDEEEEDSDTSLDSDEAGTGVKKRKLSSSSSKKVKVKSTWSARARTPSVSASTSASKGKKRKAAEDDSEDEDMSGSEADSDEDSEVERDIASAIKAASKKPAPPSSLHLASWLRVVLDEAHMVKDRSSSTAKAVFNLVSLYKWCLTGTPLQNRVGELYSLVRFLRIDPHAYYFCRKKGCSCKSLHYRFSKGTCMECNHIVMNHFCHFNRHILNPIKRCGYVAEGRKAMMQLKEQVLDEILLRRTKDTRAEDIQLPPRIVCVRQEGMDEREDDFYQALYTQSQAQFDTYVASGTVLNNYAHIFDILIRLRQAVDHPYLVIHSDSSATRAVVGGLSMSKNEEEEEEEDTDCCVCHDPADMEGTSTINRATCGHVFCSRCLSDLLDNSVQQTTECPCCSLPLTISTVKTSGSNSRPTRKRSSFLDKIDLSKFQSSTKLEILMQELDAMRRKDPGAKALVFSQFVNMLDLVEHRLSLGGLRSVKLVGSLSLDQRDKAVTSFREDPGVTAMLISLKAGGVALNLTASNYVFLMDPWWNPAAEMQAIDRTHRIGQHRPIYATRIIIRDSIEARLLALQQKKKLVFDGTVGGDSSSMARLTVDDMRFLFQ